MLGYFILAFCECLAEEEPSWTWLRGLDLVNYHTIYGTPGVAAPDNWPGARSSSATWTTPDGRFWLFGGGRGYTNNLWSFDPVTACWTCVSDPHPLNQPGTYGTRGVEDPANWPGARRGVATCVDRNGMMWLFGGDGEDGSGMWGYFNDLWRYNPATGCWAWISGSQTVDAMGVFGSMRGEAGPANTPGGLRGAAMWADARGRLWLFGGYGSDALKSWGYLNCLWRFDPATGQWTWVQGSNLVGQIDRYGPQGVASTSSMPGARSRACAWTAPGGKFWLYGGLSAEGLRGGLWNFDSETELWTWVRGGGLVYNKPGIFGTQGRDAPENTPGGRAYAAAWTGRDGTLWLMGGQGIDPLGKRRHLSDLWRFDPKGGTWCWLKGRGDATDNEGKAGEPEEAALDYTPGARWSANAWTDQSGQLWLFGGYQLNNEIDWESLNDLWRYNPASGNWTWIKGYNRKFAGIYEEPGRSSPESTPGARSDAVTWADSRGRLWLYGGMGYDVYELYGGLEDLWRLEPTSCTWTWVKGSANFDCPPLFGPPPEIEFEWRSPGGRQNSCGWVGQDDRLWLFGGETKGALRNDLWVFNPETTNWTWVKGSYVANTAGIYGVCGAEAPANTPGARWGGMQWRDGAGDFWLFGGWGYGDSTEMPGPLGDLWRFSPASGNWTWVRGPSNTYQWGLYGTKRLATPDGMPGGRSGGATWVGKDGRFWLFGGEGIDGAGDQGVLNDLWCYDPRTSMWTWVTGSDRVNQPGVFGERGVAAPENTPGARTDAAHWTDRAGRLWLFGGCGMDREWSPQRKMLNGVWVFDPRTEQWTWVKGECDGNKFGTYGTQGVTRPENTPGSLQGGATWSTADGKMWLFGGEGYEPPGYGPGVLMDLWQLDPSETNGVRAERWRRYE